MGEESKLPMLSTPGWPMAQTKDSGSIMEASKAFSFPYPTAYRIQIDLMQAVFRTIEKGKVGLFESPTGTGKSLSLICAAFTWLQLNSERDCHDQADTGGGEDPDWVIVYEKRKKEEERTWHEDSLRKRIETTRKKQAASKTLQNSKSKRVRMQATGIEDGGGSDSEFLVAEAEQGGKAGVNVEDDTAYLSPAVKALMEQMNPSESKPKEVKPFYARKGGQGDDGEEGEPETTPKIIYASRTHTQLSQFVSELKKTSFGKDIDVVEVDESKVEPIRNISLGSRKQMCINPSVQDLGGKAGMEAMNERCLELMKGVTSQTKKSHHCQYLPPGTETGQARLLDYRDNIFTQVRDIEDIVQLGREMEVCPYFGARSSAGQAQLVTLPYNLLLQANARASLNINLKDSIVIIDEAHNLIDTILSIHTVTITSKHVQQAQEQIREYLKRFSSKLRGSNEVNLKKLSKILESLSRECKEQQKKFQEGGGMMEEIVEAIDLVRRLGGNLDQVNLIELEGWLKETQIARKVAGYAEKQRARSALDLEGGSAKASNQSALSAMHTIEAFLLSLANKSDDGRVLLTMSKEVPAEEAYLTLKYQLLNPADSFQDIVSQARSVVLAGGTMEPISDFTTQLFADLDVERLTTFSCNHVIPPENLMAAVVAKGPKGSDLEFKFDARNDAALLDDLTNCIANYCNVIPHGIVVFLPSYAFLDALSARWKISQGLRRIEVKKAIFYEPKLALQVDIVLREYTAAASSTGAILFAVVGAKLSEGINFSDRLARAVIMVGMPFANSASPELAERMKYVRMLNNNSTIKSKTKDPGQELYVNLCMKAVNQSIGRAIRHQSDYAALILLDRRYSRKDIRERLPAWIRPSVATYDSFGPSMSALGAFFREKKAKKSLLTEVVGVISV